jgi:FecR-like protein
MKLMGNLAKQLVVGAGVFVGVAVISVAQAQTQQGKATVTAVKGSAEYSTGGAYMSLKPGTVLRSGSTIRTAGGSHVDLSLGKNNGVVRVAESSEVALDRLTYTETGADLVIDTQINLKDGRVLGNANRKMSPASKYEVKTPVGVAGIRGTKYDIRSNGRVLACDDKVYWVHQPAGGQPTPYVVNAGSQFEPGVGISRTPADIAEVVCRDIGGIGGAAGEERLITVAPLVETFVSPLIGAKPPTSD